MLTTKIFKIGNNNYKTALKVLWAPILISLILFTILTLVGLANSNILVIIISILILILYIWLIGKSYKISIGKAFFIAIVSSLFLSIFYTLVIVVSWAYIADKIMGGISQMIIVLF